MTAEVDRLRETQRECAAAAIASVGSEREYALLGMSDYLIEEMIVLYWSDAIRERLLLSPENAGCPVGSGQC